MGLEKVGSQFRIRIRAPSKFSKLRTKDVGNKGGLMLIVGRLKGKTKTTTQSIRLSTKDFRRSGEKLIPRTKRGIKERTTLKQRRTGPFSKAVKRYF